MFGGTCLKEKEFRADHYDYTDSRPRGLNCDWNFLDTRLTLESSISSNQQGGVSWNREVVRDVPEGF
jgi:hypothetical protein